MLSHSNVFSVLAFITLAAATSADQCVTGKLQCCDSVEKASSPSSVKALSVIDVIITDVDVLVGLACDPITVIGVASGTSCTANPVCCNDNTHKGLISIGCVPVTL